MAGCIQQLFLPYGQSEKSTLLNAAIDCCGLTKVTRKAGFHRAAVHLSPCVSNTPYSKDWLSGVGKKHQAMEKLSM